MPLVRRAALRAGVAALIGVGLTCSAWGGIVDVPWTSVGPAAVASNQPDGAGVWAGAAQSFVAEDAQPWMGVWVNDPVGLGGQVRYTLLSGTPGHGRQLASAVMTIPTGRPNTSRLVQTQFKRVTLVPGLVYSLLVTAVDGQLPAAGEATGLRLPLSSYDDGSSYPAGEIHLYRSVGSPAWTLGRDLAFHMAPTRKTPP